VSGFTKGPWRVSKNKARRVTNEHGVVICNAVLRNQGGPKHKSFMKDEHEAEANADLLSAAPDLLAAAEDALAGWNYIRAAHGDLYGVGWDRVEKALSAAIAKARGTQQTGEMM
jgi:hypothetical protein